MLIESDGEPDRRAGGRRPDDADRAIAEHSPTSSSPTARRCRPASARCRGDRRAAGRGRRRRLRHPHRDVHRRPDAPAQGRQGHQPQGTSTTVSRSARSRSARAELYDWLHENDEVAFLPVERVNDPHVIAQNRKIVTINGALAVDIHGQVVADTLRRPAVLRHRRRRGLRRRARPSPADGRSLLCMHSTADGRRRARQPHRRQHPAGAVITTPRHQIDVVVTEYGAAELEGLTVRERGRRSPRSRTRTSATSCATAADAATGSTAAFSHYFRVVPLKQARK